MVVVLAIFDALTDVGSDKVLRHPSVADRIKRRPILFRIGGGLIALGLLPVVATLGSLLRDRYDPGPGVMPIFAMVAAALISLGSVILSRAAAPPAHAAGRSVVADPLDRLHPCASIRWVGS